MTTPSSEAPTLADIQDAIFDADTLEASSNALELFSHVRKSRWTDEHTAKLVSLCDRFDQQLGDLAEEMLSKEFILKNVRLFGLISKGQEKSLQELVPNYAHVMQRIGEKFLPYMLNAGPTEFSKLMRGFADAKLLPTKAMAAEWFQVMTPRVPHNDDDASLTGMLDMMGELALRNNIDMPQNFVSALTDTLEQRLRVGEYPTKLYPQLVTGLGKLVKQGYTVSDVLFEACYDNLQHQLDAKAFTHAQSTELMVGLGYVSNYRTLPEELPGSLLDLLNYQLKPENLEIPYPTSEQYSSAFLALAHLKRTGYEFPDASFNEFAKELKYRVEVNHFNVDSLLTMTNALGVLDRQGLTIGSDLSRTVLGDVTKQIRNEEFSDEQLTTFLAHYSNIKSLGASFSEEFGNLDHVAFGKLQQRGGGRSLAPATLLSMAKRTDHYVAMKQYPSPVIQGFLYDSLMAVMQEKSLDVETCTELSKHLGWIRQNRKLDVTTFSNALSANMEKHVRIIDFNLPRLEEMFYHLSHKGIMPSMVLQERWLNYVKKKLSSPESDHRDLSRVLTTAGNYKFTQDPELISLALDKFEALSESGAIRAEHVSGNLYSLACLKAAGAEVDDERVQRLFDVLELKEDQNSINRAYLAGKVFPNMKTARLVPVFEEGPASRTEEQFFEVLTQKAKLKEEESQSGIRYEVIMDRGEVPGAKTPTDIILKVQKDNMPGETTLYVHFDGPDHFIVRPDGTEEYNGSSQLQTYIADKALAAIRDGFSRVDYKSFVDEGGLIDDQQIENIAETLLDQLRKNHLQREVRGIRKIR